MVFVHKFVEGDEVVFSDVELEDEDNIAIGKPYRILAEAHWIPHRKRLYFLDEFGENRQYPLTDDGQGAGYEYSVLMQGLENE